MPAHAFSSSRFVSPKLILLAPALMLAGCNNAQGTGLDEAMARAEAAAQRAEAAQHAAEEAASTARSRLNQIANANNAPADSTEPAPAANEAQSRTPEVQESPVPPGQPG